MNKEKQQIEEMAITICRKRHACSLKDGESCRKCDQHERCLYQDIAYALYQECYRKQEWISVEDRLPEEKVNCLVHYKHAYCDNDGYWNIGVSFYDGHEFHIGLEYKVTHWMPLPEAPKMKGGE